MGLRMKFNLVLSVVFIIGLGLAGLIFYQMLQKNARAEILNNAGLMLASALAVRDYTITEIRPLLSDKLDIEFLPQTVPLMVRHGILKNYGSNIRSTAIKKQHSIQRTHQTELSTGRRISLGGLKTIQKRKNLLEKGTPPQVAHYISVGQ